MLVASNQVEMRSALGITARSALFMAGDRLKARLVNPRVADSIVTARRLR